MEYGFASHGARLFHSTVVVELDSPPRAAAPPRMTVATVLSCSARSPATGMPACTHNRQYTRVHVHAHAHEMYRTCRPPWLHPAWTVDHGHGHAGERTVHELEVFDGAARVRTEDAVGPHNLLAHDVVQAELQQLHLRATGPVRVGVGVGIGAGAGAGVGIGVEAKPGNSGCWEGLRPCGRAASGRSG